MRPARADRSASFNARPPLRVGSAWMCAVASVAVHVALVVTGRSWILAHIAPPPRDIEVDVEGAARDGDEAGSVDAARLPSAKDPHDVPTEVRAPGAGARVARADNGVRGLGGERTSPRATHLSDSVDDLDLSHQTPSHLERDQLQRVKSERERRTLDDRRAAREPMELSFVSTGQGRLALHEDAARVRPHGSTDGSMNPSRAGAERDPRDGEGDDNADARGAAESVVARGLAQGDEARASERADVMRARPLVDRALPSVPAEAHAKKTADNVDSLDLARAKTRSLVHASFAGGEAEDLGRGGDAHATAQEAPGAGGEHEQAGSHVAPLGNGGATADWNTSDPRFTSYFLELHKKLDPLWRNAFPQEARLAMRQGTVIFEMDVDASGAVSLAWPPKRPSGIAQFDENVAAAIRRASPFPPFPANLREAGVRKLHIKAPFTAGTGFAP